MQLKLDMCVQNCSVPLVSKPLTQFTQEKGETEGVGGTGLLYVPEPELV